MHRFAALRGIAASLAWAALLAPAFSQSPDDGAALARGDTAIADYARPESWLCRPGVDDGTCSANLDAVAVDEAARRTPAPFVAADDPPIDCFFVYPTSSGDPTRYSDMTPDQGEKRAVHGEAARLRAACRLFVPIYHSLTLAGLRWGEAHPRDQAATGDGPLGFDPPYRSIVAAWRAYLAHDNGGRGVVLIGHSQGAILLQRLIADEIDGKPAQRRLVSAFLAGNVDLSARSFGHIPPCEAPGQTGCVVAWSSYRAGYDGARVFGGTKDGAPPLCVNPAALAGGSGLAKAYFPRPSYAPAGDPPYVALVGQLRVVCARDAKGAVLRVTVVPGPVAGLLEGGLARLSGLSPDWGMHPIDIALVQGNIVDMIAAQATSWALPRRR